VTAAWLKQVPGGVEANAALMEFLADELDLRRADVELLDGASSRRKRLLLRGVDCARVLGVISSSRR